MKKSRKLISLFNFLAIVFVAMVAGINPLAASGIAYVGTTILDNIPSMSGALSGFITNGSEFKGKEMEDIIIRPFFIGVLPKDMGIRVFTTVKSTFKLTFFGAKSKILKAYADGFQGGTGADKTQKKIELQEFKAEASYSKQDYKNTILENITNVGGIKQNEITGTAVHNAEVSVFMNGIMEDARRIFWLGKKLKYTLHASGYYTATADVDYNVIEGIWTSVMTQAAVYSSATNDQVRRIIMANGGVAQVATHTLTGTGGTANIPINGVNYLATFATSLAVTATNFVATHGAALLLRGITATATGVTVVLTATIPGQPFLSTVIVNVSGDLAGSVVQTTANTPAQDLGTDEAVATFKLMFNNSTQVLKRLIQEGGNVRLYATDTMIENYQSTLEGQLLESSRTAIIDGIKRFTYRGVAIIPMKIDQHLAADFNEPYPHRAMLTTADNLGLVVNGASDFAETAFWFNQDENKNRQRTQFEFGADFILPELITVAY